jgi:hypothetical protein
VVLLAAPAAAEVVRIDVKSRADIAGGQAYGTVGPYEKLAGTIFFAVDPALPANKIVADIDKAPRNAAGKVEFSADFFLIKPKAMERANGAVLYEVSNRGGKGMLGFFNHATGSSDPGTAAEMGDGFLMQAGLHAAVGRVAVRRAAAPGPRPRLSADADRERPPIRGLVRSDFVVTDRETDHSLADRNHVAYAVADPQSPDNVLTVRDSVEGPRRIIPRDQWSLDSTGVRMAAKFEPNKIYEVVYTSENPPLVGLGPRPSATSSRC